jgi:hypothetical protein
MGGLNLMLLPNVNPFHWILFFITHLASSGWIDPDTKPENKQRVSNTDGNVR